MDSTASMGTWNEQKDILKKKFAALTNNDLLFEQGKKEGMMNRLQNKLGKTKEEIQQILAAI